MYVTVKWMKYIMFIVNHVILCDNNDVSYYYTI